MIEFASIPYQGVLASAIVGHLVGDFILQDDFLASGKKRSSWICAAHCAIWTASVLAFSGWFIGRNCILIAVILFSTHFVQDRTNIVLWWMRLKWKDQTKFSNPPLGPWSVIVIDNIFHILTIWLVWKFVAYSIYDH